MLRMILECLSSEERRRFLHTEVYDDGYTLVHLIAQVDHTGATMKTILESISKDQHYSLLSTQDGLKYTPLHWACVYNNSVAVLDAITRLTSEETRFKLLQIPSSGGRTALHYAAARNATEDIKIIAESVNTSHRMRFLGLTEKCGDTPVQRAAVRGKQAAVQLLQEYHIDIRIEEALQETDERGTYFYVKLIEVHTSYHVDG